MKALILAESCNPEWESVPLVGWSHYHAIAQLVDTHLITRSRNLPELLRAGLVQDRDFTVIDTEALFAPMARFVEMIAGPNKGWAMLQALSLPSYFAFEHIAWKRFGARIRAGEFDVVHRLTPVSPAVPSPLAARCRRAGVPFVLGPINGGLPWPAQFPDLRRREREFISGLRELYRYVPSYRSTRDSASAIMVGSAGALEDLERRWHDKAIYMPENAIEPDRFADPPMRVPQDYAGRPLRAICLGRMVPFKGMDMVLDAAAGLLRDGRMTLDIAGFGPERPVLEAQAAALGLGGNVRFLGKIPHPEISELLRHADVLPYPSVREFGGGVVLEAMAMGVVPIAIAYGGPAELITPQSAFALELAPRAQIVAALRSRLEALVAEPGQLAAMSRAAIARVQLHFTWPAKARETLEVYRWVLGERATRPGGGGYPHDEAA